MLSQMVTEQADGAARRSRILVVGLPRSGTTWLSQAVGVSRGTCSVGEPDNEDRFPYAIKAKAALGRFPVLAPGATAPPAYVRLWDGAFSGGRPPRHPTAMLSEVLHATAKRGSGVDESAQWPWPRRAALLASVALSRPLAASAADRVVVKSVFAPFALAWLCERWDPRLVLVVKSPLNTVASWKVRGWRPPLDGHPLSRGPAGFGELLDAAAPGRSFPPPPTDGAPARTLSWQLCVLMAVLLDFCVRRDDVVTVHHEAAAAEPVSAFSSVYEQLGLPWDASVEQFIAGSNVAGSGVYDAHRVGAEEAHRWRDRLTDREARAVRETVAEFDIPWGPADA